MIGLFDSGAGGLFVLNNLREAYPEEDFFFLADTANFPYGEKEDAAIRLLALQCGKILERRGCSAVLVACNTATALGLDLLRSSLSVPVMGPIEAAAREAMAKTRNGKIGVLATVATVRTGIYQRLLSDYDTLICESPLLASLVEEAQIPQLGEALNRYVKPMLAQGIDTLVLGCTHYPFLENLLKGCPFTLVDSAKSFIPEVAHFISKGEGKVEIECTGKPVKYLAPCQKDHHHRGRREHREEKIVSFTSF